MSGDLNMGLDAQIDRQGTLVNNSKAAEVVNKWTHSNKMLDTWRFTYPDKNGFTWRRLKPKPTFSRLDYCIVSDNLQQILDSVRVIPGFRTDHSILHTKLRFCKEKKGAGYWKLNTSLLKNIEYVNAMNRLIEIELGQNNELKKKVKWEVFKVAIRGSSIQFASRLQKSNKMKINLLEKKLVCLAKEAERGGGLFEDTEIQTLRVKNKLEELIKMKTKGAMIRSKVNWALHGEKPNKYFLGLEKKRALSKTIIRLKKENDTIVEGQEVIDEIRQFYERLYTSSNHTDLSFTEKLDNSPNLTRIERGTGPTNNFERAR